MSTDWIKSPSARATYLAGLLTMSLALAFASPARADVSKLFNATHSLTGDCSTSGVDPVPDPGCPVGAHPPEGKLVEPNGIGTDAYGNVYALNRNESEGASAFHVDVFGPDGRYLTSVARAGAEDMTVDSHGHIYITYRILLGGGHGITRLVRYDPTIYDPEAGEIEYGSTPVLLRELEDSPPLADPIPQDMTVNFSNDHLVFRSRVFREGECGEAVCPISILFEYGPPTPGVPNELLAESPLDVDRDEGPLAFDLARDRLYVLDAKKIDIDLKTYIRVFDSEAPYDLIETIDGSSIPRGNLGENNVYRYSLAVDEATGHIFIGEILSDRKLYELDEDFNLVGEVKKPTLENQYGQVAIDNSEASPNQGYLYVPSGYAPAGRLFAFEPVAVPEPPEIESTSVSGLTETEAVLRGEVNPKGIPAHWAIEYTSQQDFEVEGFAGAATAGEGDLPASGEAIAVQAPATSLLPGTAYRLRVRAENECEPEGEPCMGEADAGFTTFGADKQDGSCANAALRTGASAVLPDCRAYELVTPADTNGLLPEAPNSGTSGPEWPTPSSSPAGNSLAFMIFGGLIPGMDATGGPTEIGDTYVSTRTAAGWLTKPKSPSGSQATRGYTSGLSSDHGYMPVEVDEGGSLLLAGERSNYVRYPGGEFVLVGEGSIGTALTPEVHYVSPGGSHILFSNGLRTQGSLPQLEPSAPPDGTRAIYDRLPDGTLRVVSLLPGELTPTGGAVYTGASNDGSTVAFSVGGEGPGPLYLRLDNAETLVGAPAGSEYAGLSADGRYLFYMLGGDLHRFDSSSETSEPVTETGDVDPVNIGNEGTGAYYLSPTALPTAPNPEGDEPEGGAYNLYHWDGVSTRFVAAVTERDADGKDDGPGSSPRLQDGLGLWLEAVETSPALLASRTTPEGDVLLFESRAALTAIDSAGKAQLFRYDAGAGTLLCLSCNPTGATPQGEALLVAPFLSGTPDPDADPNALNISTVVPNLSADSTRAFFETAERLVSRDNDGKVDVYEWEAKGTGTCAEPGGCVFLISSGQSGRGEHLFGVSESGDDVFILSSDLLTSDDRDEAPSVYDARVGGGFPAAAGNSGECLGEACLPTAQAPEAPSPASSTFRGPGNLRAQTAGARRCRRAARRATALRRRARRLAAVSRRARSPRRTAMLRRRAKGLARKARRSTRSAERCRARLRSVRRGSR